MVTAAHWRKVGVAPGMYRGYIHRVRGNVNPLVSTIEACMYVKALFACKRRRGLLLPETTHTQPRYPGRLLGTRR